MDDITALRAAIAAGPTPGPMEICSLNTPLEKSGEYVQECVNVSGGPDFFFVRGERADGVPVDVAHFGNGPTSNVNGHWLATASPDRITRVLDALEASQAECARLRADAERYRWLRDKARTARAVALIQCMPGEMDAAIDAARAALATKETT